MFNNFPFENRTVSTESSTINPDTNETVITITNTTTADFIVSFVRSLSTGDAADFTLERNVVDAYWVFGAITNNNVNITEAIAATNQFGATTFDLTETQVQEPPLTDNTPANPSSNSVSLMFQSVTVLSVFAALFFY